MKAQQKESYVQPVLVKHELLRDITATRSGYGNGHGYGYGNGPRGNWGNWGNWGRH
ncbi:MAG: hypothetical protein KF722_12680 [Nitrospira sp.]|nr:hypothetical protein [Nitrospira sp.]